MAKTPKTGTSKRRSKLKAPDSPVQTASEGEDEPDRDLEEESGEVLESQLRHIGVLQAAIETTIKAGDATPALAREAANVARAAVMLDQRLSKRRQELQGQFRKLTKKAKAAAVVEWLCTLPKEMRREAAERLKAK